MVQYLGKKKGKVGYSFFLMASYSPATPPPPPEFDAESLTTPLNPNPPSRECSVSTIITDSDPSGPPAPQQPFDIESGQSPPPAGGGSENTSWLTRRSRKAARFSPPLKQCFDQLDLWKVLTIIGGIFGCVITLCGLKFISEEFAKTLLALLFPGKLCLVAAVALQDTLPELAAPAMISGISLLISLFHAVGFKFFPLSDNRVRLVLSLFLFAYICLLVFTVYQLFKYDVREEEADAVEDPPSGSTHPH